MDKSKIKINIETGEIEIEGSQQFIEQQLDNLENIIEIISNVKNNNLNEEFDELIEEKKQEEDEKISNVGEQSLEVTDTFGEWFHKFNDDLTEDDYALIAAYFVQKKESKKDEFKTSQITSKLKEHGIKLSNTSRSLKSLRDKKLAFQTRRDGGLILYRVSADGIKYLKSLLRNE